MMGHRLDALLTTVGKPSRYINHEWNAFRKDKPSGRVVLCYPDVYEVGTSNLGLQILYEIINGQTEFAAERVYSPWPDMEEALRHSGQPLTSLESGKPVGEADILGFTLQYELTFTNVLNILDLSGLPVRSAERLESRPLVLAGGPCAYNPEPLAPFVDAFVIGEAEELIVELLDCLQSWKVSGHGKRRLLEQMAAIEGVYVPAFYGPNPFLQPPSGLPERISKRIVTDFDKAPAPLAPVVPYAESVHDRAAVEIMRGCTRGCRFCQAGMIYRPVRERSPEKARGIADCLIRSTGYDELSLVSLSSTDHSEIEAMVERFKELERERIRVSLPSLRVSAHSVEMASALAPGRRPALTLAPEAGSQRLRDVINKGVREEDIDSALMAVFRGGWQGLKLYFMIGLPTETDDDLRAVADIGQRALSVARETHGNRLPARLRITVSASTFVPKSHTPFQWLGLIRPEEIERKQDFLKETVVGRNLDLKWTDVETTILEAAISRGGREMAAVIERAWRLGCRFDGWSESARPDLWREAAAEEGLDLVDYACRELPTDGPLPWEHIGSLVDKNWLLEELRRSRECLVTEDCRDSICSICGVCQELDIDSGQEAGRRLP